MFVGVDGLKGSYREGLPFASAKLASGRALWSSWLSIRGRELPDYQCIKGHAVRWPRALSWCAKPRSRARGRRD